MKDIFDGKTAIVTGGTSGIGLGVCDALLKRGAHVYVIGSRESSVAKVKEQFSQYPNARFAAVDVKDNAAVEKIVRVCMDEFGHLDYMFNNAGISQKFPYEAVTLDLWKEMIDTNLWGVIYGVNAALSVMRKQGSGQIINTASMSALFCNPYQQVYNTTKCGVIGLTKSLRYEYEPRNIFFTVVCPGNVATPIFEGNIPPNSISVDESAQIILDGVAKKDLMIIFPKDMAEFVDKCKDPAISDIEMRKFEQETRKIYEADPKYDIEVNSLFKR